MHQNGFICRRANGLIEISELSHYESCLCQCGDEPLSVLQGLSVAPCITSPGAAPSQDAAVPGHGVQVLAQDGQYPACVPARASAYSVFTGLGQQDCEYTLINHTNVCLSFFKS